MIVTLPIPAPCRTRCRVAFRRVAGGALSKRGRRDWIDRRNSKQRKQCAITTSGGVRDNLSAQQSAVGLDRAGKKVVFTSCSSCLRGTDLEG